MSTFNFRQFSVAQAKSAMKVGTDAVLLGCMIEIHKERRCLEMGSGTGVISLMLAQRFDRITIDAIEIDRDAFEESSFNFSNSPWTERLQSRNDDFFLWNPLEKYDLIFSNPPFYVNTLQPDDERLAISKHALFSFQDFLKKANVLLNDSGVLWLIVTVELADVLVKSSCDSGFYPGCLIRIYGRPGKHSRTILCLSKVKCEMHTKDFVVRTDEGAYSEEYILLTRDFHDREIK
jgi:tRNA1Val (adenine37-N6)-methyltransferase